MSSIYSKEKTRPFSRYFNPWFIVPFLLWLAVGGFLLLSFNKKELFRPANAHHTAFLDFTMNWITQLGHGSGIVCIMLLVLLLFKFGRKFWWYIISAIVCIGAPALLGQWIKSIIRAPRPFEYFSADNKWIHFDASWGDRLYHDSFPSGHSTGAFSMFCFLAMLLPVKYAKLGLLLLSCAMLVGYSRMYLAAHFFADVYSGSIVGTLGCLVCYAVCLKWRPDNVSQLSTDAGEA